MRQETLAQLCKDKDEDIRRKDIALDAAGGRAIGLRQQLEFKTVQVNRKKRGVVDARGWGFVRQTMYNQIFSNLCSAPITIVGMVSSDEFTWWIVLHIILNSVLGPVKTFFNKRSEVF